MILVPLLIVIAVFTYKLPILAKQPDPALAWTKVIMHMAAVLQHNVFANLLVLSGLLATNFLFGVTCAFFSPRRAAYTYAIFGTLAQALPPFVGALGQVMAKQRPELAAPLIIGGEVVPLACIAAAFFAAYLMSRRRERNGIKAIAMYQ